VFERSEMPRSISSTKGKAVHGDDAPQEN